MQGTPFGRYRLLDRLGSGGMGEVRRAYDTNTGRDVAIKVLHAHFAKDSAFEQRFRREAYAAARLNNPHVVPIHDFGEIEGRLYVDMRLVEGSDLTSVLEAGPMDPRRAVHVIEQVASALHTAHQSGLVHRDVKPSNIMLDSEDFAYLIDFGIAHAITDTRLTGTGNAIGTYAYMAPERFTDDPLDPRCDVYALACVLYECLTGAPPFTSQQPAQLVAAHLSTPPPRPSAVRPELPRAFDGVVAKGMAKQQDDRYATAKDLARAAAGALTGPPAPPPTPPPLTPTQQAPPQQTATQQVPTQQVPTQLAPAQQTPTWPAPLAEQSAASTRFASTPPHNRPPSRPPSAPPPLRPWWKQRGNVIAGVTCVLALIALVALLVVGFGGGDTVDPVTTTTSTTTKSTAVTTAPTTQSTGTGNTEYQICANGKRIPVSQSCPEPPRCPDDATAQNGSCLCPDATTTVVPGETCPAPVPCPEGAVPSEGGCRCPDGTNVAPGGTCPDQPCPEGATGSGGQCVCTSTGASVAPGGSCPLPEPCPPGTTGTPPSCVSVPSAVGAPRSQSPTGGEQVNGIPTKPE